MQEKRIRFFSKSLLRVGVLICLALYAGVFLFGQRFQPAVVEFGDPLPGITAAEFERFRLGLEDFLEVEEPDEGLGPLFNGRSCAECHNIPAIGGSGHITEIRAGRRNPDGTFDPLPGGSLFQMFSIPPHDCQEVIPSDANVVAARKSIPLFGAGLVEAIPDETLRALADPDDQNGDGISGRVHGVFDVATESIRAGRFGWKAQEATLLAFGAGAYLDEMGITNELAPLENAPNGDLERLRLCDPLPSMEDRPDPATRLRGIDNFEAFMKFLGPPPRGEITNAVLRGEQVFAQVNCVSCHVPVLFTGPSANPVFDRRPVPLFSNLLLHDIGTGDGIVQGEAQGEEIRTPALWGLRVRRGLLHDGSAATPAEAILRHDREAAEARRQFENLAEADRQALLDFLQSL